MEEAYNKLREVMTVFVRAIMTDRAMLPQTCVQVINAAREMLKIGDTAQPELKARYEDQITGQLRKLATLSKALASDSNEAPTDLTTALTDLDRLTREWMVLWREKDAADQKERIRTAPSSGAPESLTSLFKAAVALLTLVLDTLDPLVDCTPEVAQTSIVNVAQQTKALMNQWKTCTEIHYLIPDDKGVILVHLQRLVMETKEISATTDKHARARIVRTTASLAEQISSWFAEHYSMTLKPVNVMIEARKVDALNRLAKASRASVAVTPSPASSSSLSPSLATTTSTTSSSPASSSSLPSSSGASLTIPPSSTAVSSSSRSPSPSPLDLQSQQRSSSPADDDPAERSKQSRKLSGDSLSARAILKPHYSESTLVRWDAKFFAVAHEDFDGSAHGDLAMSFKRGELIAVYDNSDSSLWQGANPETEKYGYFPSQYVRIIEESTKIREKQEKATPSIVVAQEDVVEIDRKKQEEIKALKEAMKIKAPPPERTGDLQLYFDKKFINTVCVLSDGVFYFSKPLKKGTVKAVSLPCKTKMNECVIRPATTNDAPKDELDRCFVMVNKTSNETHCFVAKDKNDRVQWLEVMTVASLALNNKDLRRESYSYTAEPKRDSLRGMPLKGIDSSGNVSVVKAGSSSLRGVPEQKEQWMEGLTEEQIERYKASLPSKSMIHKMSGGSQKSLRLSGIFGSK